MDSRPFTAPAYDRSGKRPPTTDWALSVLAEWEDRGYPELDGPPVEQLKLARSILRLNEPWDGDTPGP